jgi:hypothetical protein
MKNRGAYLEDEPRRELMTNSAHNTGLQIDMSSSWQEELTGVCAQSETGFRVEACLYGHASVLFSMSVTIPTVIECCMLKCVCWICCTRDRRVDELGSSPSSWSSAEKMAEASYATMTSPDGRTALSRRTRECSRLMSMRAVRSCGSYQHHASHELVWRKPRPLASASDDSPILLRSQPRLSRTVSEHTTFNV